MTETPIDDLNVLEEKPLVTPAALKSLFPLSEGAEQTIIESRQTIRSILSLSLIHISEPTRPY